MIKITLFFFFVAIIFNASAQRGKTIELKGISHQGFTYYYDLKKVDGGAYGLQIPLLSLNDEEINRRYKSFKRMRTVEGLVGLVPLIYLFYYVSPQRHHSDLSTFWAVWGTSIGAMVLIEIKAKSHLRKAIDRYNSLVLGPGVSGPGAYGPGLSISFKF